ncbi:MAG: TonB-dependent receptor [Bacteroidota bacterium]
MRFRLFLVLLFLIFTTPQASLAQILTGHVVDIDGPLSQVTVGIPELGRGTYTDSTGFFRLSSLPAGSYTLRVTSVGYQSHEQTIRIPRPDSASPLRIQLEIKQSQLDELVITGTMRATNIKDSPVKVEVVSNEFLDQNPAGSIMESVDYINGLSNQVSCGVCGTNSIRINGMDGPYTAVLLDGMPLMGALASVYGLNGIHPSLIRSMEIIKGPNSTLYGSQAMAGVINIRTYDASEIPAFAIEFNGNTHQALDGSFSTAHRVGEASTLLAAHGHYMNNFVDENEDGFADVVNTRRISLLNKWEIPWGTESHWTSAAKLYLEDRLGGVQPFDHDLRGSDSVYGESIYTKRLEWTHKLTLPNGIALHLSSSWHQQDSFYGDYQYIAQQWISFGQLLWRKRFNINHHLTLGMPLTYDQLDQSFNASAKPGEQFSPSYKRVTPALFAQWEYRLSESLQSILGMRMERHQEHGWIASPRFSLMGQPSSHTRIRLNAGTGFRRVNVFTEEHDVLTGSRDIRFAESLNPERSYNATLNWNQIIDIGPTILNTDLDLFYTHFTNQIIPDYSTSHAIVYRNLERFSVSRGISLSLGHSFPSPLEYKLGITYQQVYEQQDGRKTDVLYSPNWSGVASLSYTIKPWDLSIDYRSRFTGQMPLPKYEGYEAASQPYMVHNLTLTHPLSEQIAWYLGVQNIFNYTQRNPIIEASRPFSEDFATDRVYGPIQGRRFQLGVRIQVQ